MGAYIAAADAIRQAFECAVVIIHHCGIEGTRPRGHTSLTGAVDAQIAMKRDAGGNIIAEVEWMKDGDAEGDTIASALEVVEIGIDDDDELITSCVIVPVEVAAPLAPRQKMSPNQQTMLTMLQAAGPAGLMVDELNDQAREAGIGIKRHATLYDTRMALKQRGLAHESGGRWYASN
jgi:hypothetical protein